jgi:hypothetical protein
MDGMFYSLKEAAKKLNKTVEELKGMVKEGKLREFRDGPNLLFKVEEVEALMSDTSVSPSEETPSPEALEPEMLELESAELEAEEPETPELEISELEPSELEMSALETPEPQALSPETPAPSEQEADTDEILLAPETGVSVPPSELTDADTAITGEGISVLGETDRDYQVTDDTMAETAVPPGTTGTMGTTPEVPLEKIEEDVNLDSFGSGSGLLDLSLQADDTSLGGVLDEIYTAEVEAKEPAEAAAPAVDVAAEAEQMLPEEEEFVGPQSAPEIAALAQPYIELAPDVQSNTFGMLLFLPLVVVVYTAVVVVAGLRGVMPSILTKVQGIIWYILLGAVVLSVLVVGAAFMLGGGPAKAETKPKKPKKQKKPKEPKKAKKANKASP